MTRHGATTHAANWASATLRDVTPVRLDPSREWLTRDEAAELWGGITPAGFSSLVSKGLAPPPATHVGRTPMWDSAEIREWAARRPGRGNWR